MLVWPRLLRFIVCIQCATLGWLIEALTIACSVASPRSTAGI